MGVKIIKNMHHVGQLLESRGLFIRSRSDFWVGQEKFGKFEFFGRGEASEWREGILVVFILWVRARQAGIALKSEAREVVE